MPPTPCSYPLLSTLCPTPSSNTPIVIRRKRLWLLRVCLSLQRLSMRARSVSSRTRRTNILNCFCIRKVMLSYHIETLRNLYEYDAIRASMCHPCALRMRNMLKSLPNTQHNMCRVCVVLSRTVWLILERPIN